MADLIAREDYALSIGGGGCSSYAANRGVTKARAISMGASVSGSYSDNQLVPQKDLYKAGCGSKCTCDKECVGYQVACASVCEGYWCSCNGDTCPSYCGSQCYGNNASCGYCDEYAYCPSRCAGTCGSQAWCTHCFSEKTCSCDGVCNSQGCIDKICNITYGNCASICQCTSRGVICYQDSCTSYWDCGMVYCYEKCYPYCWCYGGHCHYYGEKTYGCLPNCTSQDSGCAYCQCNGDTCGSYCTGHSYNCTSHCDGYGGAGCTCWNNTTYTCTCWNQSVYG